MRLQEEDLTNINVPYLNRDIKIDLSVTKVNQEFYLCAFSYGNVYSSRKIVYTICGEE
jgi:hypothetical protein